MSDTPPTPAEQDAKKVKAEALAAKATAEAELATAEARRENALARKVEAEAATAEQTQAATRERESEKRKRELAHPHRRHLYHFSEAVRAESVDNCIKELEFWHEQDAECEIEVLFDSPGGSVFAGMNLFDFLQELKRKGHFIITSTRGMAASMGGILLQAGDKRIMGAEAYILIHEISTGAIGKIAEIEDEVKLAQKMTARVVDIFAGRSKMSKAKVKSGMRRKDWWIDSTEALKVGLVDEVR